MQLVISELMLGKLINNKQLCENFKRCKSLHKEVYDFTRERKETQ